MNAKMIATRRGFLGSILTAAAASIGMAAAGVPEAQTGAPVPWASKAAKKAAKKTANKAAKKVAKKAAGIIKESPASDLVAKKAAKKAVKKSSHLA